jgi:hypothetical protein
LKIRLSVLCLAAATVLLFAFTVRLAHAEQTINCRSGEYDLLDWMSIDSDLCESHFMTGSNPEYTLLTSEKFYYTKGQAGYPWDINLFDNNYIYLWITEYNWNDPHTYKKFTYNTNMPIAPRLREGWVPGINNYRQ